MSRLSVSVQADDFDVAAVFEKIRREAIDAGAIVSFTGLVREIYQANSSDKVQELFLEHYPGMTEKCLRSIANEAQERWPISYCLIIHRVGALLPGDQIVFVATASQHRHAAFEAAEFVMDYLKTKAPFWKRQTDSSGSKWVEYRSTDEEAVKRWES